MANVLLCVSADESSTQRETNMAFILRSQTLTALVAIVAPLVVLLAIIPCVICGCLVLGRRNKSYSGEDTGVVD